MKDLMAGVSNLFLTMVLLGAFLVVVPQVAFKIGKRTAAQPNLAETRALQDKVKRLSLALNEANLELRQANLELKQKDELVEENDHLRNVIHDNRVENDALKLRVEAKDQFINQVVMEKDSVSSVLAAQVTLYDDLVEKNADDVKQLQEANSQLAAAKIAYAEVAPTLRKAHLKVAVLWGVLLLIIILFGGHRVMRNFRSEKSEAKTIEREDVFNRVRHNKRA